MYLNSFLIPFSLIRSHISSEKDFHINTKLRNREKAVEDKEEIEMNREEEHMDLPGRDRHITMFQSKRRRKRNYVGRVTKAVPLRPRPEGLPVPRTLISEPLGNFTCLNDNFKRFYPAPNRLLYPSPMRANRSLCNENAANPQLHQLHSTIGATGDHQARNASIRPMQNAPIPDGQPSLLPNGFLRGSTRGNQARNSSVEGNRAVSHDRKDLIPVQVPNFVSSSPPYLWNWIPQEYVGNGEFVNPHTIITPSWAVGKPLCLQLSRTEIGGKLNHKEPLNQSSLGLPISQTPGSFQAGSIDLQPMVSPKPLAPQQLNRTNTQQDIHPLPLDNLTSFVKTFPSRFHMWPSWRLSQVRDKSFLSSIKDRSLSKLISRYLLEHALDQIARCDPSSELEPKWLMIPKNLYVLGSRSLLQDYDRQQGVCCSCKPEAEQNRSARYSISCSNEKCENRAMSIECVPEKCGSGESCKNTRLQRMQFPLVALQKFPEKGYGLIARETIRPGTMIGEYLGEILSEECFEKRVVKYQGEHHFYFMSLTSKLFIDASRKAGITRFINHSCDPNCTAEKWNAGGEPHVAIVAKREIKRLEEITFSYQAQLLGSGPTKCRCGSTNCKEWLTSNPVSSLVSAENIVAEREKFIAKKIQQAHSDIALAEEILQKLQCSNGDGKKAE